MKIEINFLFMQRKSCVIQLSNEDGGVSNCYYDMYLKNECVINSNTSTSIINILVI